MSNKTPYFTVVPCEDPRFGAKILCNGFPYLRTDFADIPKEEHTEMAHEIAADLARAAGGTHGSV